MDFARPNQVVVSRAYYDVISRITDSAASHFDYLGPHMDKHLRSHEIYAVMDPHAAPAAPVGRNLEFEHTASFAALASLTPEMVHEIETELAKLIGPLARVLVKKSVPRTVSAQGLRDMLAVSIPDATAREAFMRPRNASMPVHSTPVGASSPRTGTISATGSTSATSRVHSMPVSGVRHQDMSRPLGVSSTSGTSNSINVQHFSAELQVQLERALSLYIGPLAKTLVRREAARHTSLGGLAKALALQIDRPDDRAKFLAAAQKLR